jgi:trehalose 6-phosphate synthase
LTTGLDAAFRSIGGTWVAWGDGDADRAVAEDGCVTVPPDAAEDEQYTLQRVWLDEEEVQDYYHGFSNRVLWAVCHGALRNVESTQQYWETYAAVNERFADAVAAHADADDAVWLQDYHFALAPQMLRERLPENVPVAQFWHIPWPAWDTFRACPHAERLLRGVLGNDLFCVHVHRYRDQFLECVDTALPEATVDWESGRVFHREGVTTVDAFPLGVDVDRVARLARDPSSRWDMERFLADHGVSDDRHLAVGVDRLDYTKGIPARLDALEHLWETRPEWQGELTFVQIGSESRSAIPAYRELQADVEAGVERVNDRFGTDDWQPVVYTNERVPDGPLNALYRAADAGIVSPLRDGMNLVAQEFVAAQSVVDPGALVLSDQAGVYDVLGDAAVSISPHDVEGFAAQIETALSMPAAERRRRYRRLIREVERCDVSSWTDDVLERVVGLDENEGLTRV